MRALYSIIIPMTSIHLVLLDMDDTLCMTEEVLWELENLTAVSMGHPPMTRATHKNNWGKPLEFAIPERIPGIDTKTFIKKHAINLAEYLKEGKLDALSTENERVLRELKARGKKLGIVTSRTKDEMKHLLNTVHPLSNLIDGFYHKDSSPYHKPDPRVFDQPLKDFQCTPRHAVYVGDTVSDGLAAKGAELWFIASIENGLRTPQDFSGVQVDHFVTKFSDILNLIP